MFCKVKLIFVSRILVALTGEEGSIGRHNDFSFLLEWVQISSLGMHDIIGTLSVMADVGFKLTYQKSASMLISVNIITDKINTRVDTMFPMFPVGRRYVYLLCHM